MKTIGCINRTGVVSFNDASLAVWEEGEAPVGERSGLGESWERQFKRDVFARIVQTLRRLGWTVEQPPIDPHDVKYYGGTVARWASERQRVCSKGDLKGHLVISGRKIEFEMWQGVNTPTRPDHGGRYEFNKEAIMPYVLRLEMERTRRRIRDYLLAVFTGYSFDGSRQPVRPLQVCSMMAIQRHYAESSHFKGDMASYLKRNGYDKLPTYNAMSADGHEIQHGQLVWFRDRYTGRAGQGIALYNINNMWWVVTGLYSYKNIACFDLYAVPPDNLRGRHFPERRRKRLEQELAKATKAMDFERAAVLRDVLFPPGTGPLFTLRQKDGLYWGPNSSGYTRDSAEAGKYTRAEADSIIKGSNRGLVAMRVTA